MTLLRGRRDGLEVSLSERDFEEACDELEARLAEQPSFYRGSSAVVNFGDGCPSDALLGRLRGVLEGAGITLRALSGNADGLEGLAHERGLEYEASMASPAPSVEPAGLSERQLQLSDSARSLAADFAGARGDIARRRRRGEASVPRLRSESRGQRPPALHVVEASPGTLYHPGTLRGGQVLHHTGNIVVIGDVNPGAELVATGDIVVFGRLRGIAHAGARRRRGGAHLRARFVGDAAADCHVHRGRTGEQAAPRRGARSGARARRRHRRSAAGSPRRSRQRGSRAGMTARKIVLTSGKGGVGKTTTTANLGATLAKRGHRVILIDADIGLRNLDLVLGLEKRIVFDLVEVAEGRCQLRQALIKDKRFESLAILPAAQTREKDAITPEQFSAIVERAAEQADYVLIDSPGRDRDRVSQCRRRRERSDRRHDAGGQLDSRRRPRRRQDRRRRQAHPA